MLVKPNNCADIQKRSVGVHLLLVPHSEALASPCPSKRATPKPTPICTTTYAPISCVATEYAYVIYTHLMDAIVALYMTNTMKLPDFRVSSTKRKITPFLYIVPHIRRPTEVGSVIKTVQRYEIIFEKNK